MLIQLLANLRNYSVRVKPNKKPQVPFRNWKIVRGDQVQVRWGTDRGKVGKVIKVYRKSNTILVEGVNLRERRFRTQAETLMTKKTPSRIHISKVGLYDSIAKRAAKIKFGYHPETYERLRVSKASGLIIPKPKIESYRQQKARSRKIGVKDTTTQIAHKVTYQGEDFQQIKRQFQAFIAQKQRRQKNLVFIH